MDLDVRKELLQEENVNKKETWKQPLLYDLELNETLGGEYSDSPEAFNGKIS